MSDRRVGERADATGSEIAAASAPCETLDGEEHAGRHLSWQRGLLPNPCRPHRVRRKPNRKQCRQQDSSPRPGRQSSVATAAVTRVTNLPEGAKRLSILIRGPCARKSQRSEEAKGSPPITALSGCGTSPLKPTPGIGEERVRSPQTRIRKIPPSSTEVRLLHPVRSCSLAGSGKRDRKSAFPLALPLRYSRV